MVIVDIRKEENTVVWKMFEEFYNTSIFTWVGMNADRNNLYDIIKGLRLPDNTIFYIFSGEQMNDYYGLTGETMYPNDLTFVSIKDYYNPMVKIQVGARWFDDIVDNNRMREENYEQEEE